MSADRRRARAVVADGDAGGARGVPRARDSRRRARRGGDGRWAAQRRARARRPSSAPATARTSSSEPGSPARCRRTSASATSSSRRRVLDAEGEAPPPDAALARARRRCRARAPGRSCLRRPPDRRRRPGEGGLGRAGRRRSAAVDMESAAWARAAAAQRHPLRRSCGPSATAPTTSCPDIFPGAWTRTAASAAGRAWRLAAPCVRARRSDSPSPLLRDAPARDRAIARDRASALPSSRAYVAPNGAV